jgi:predicted  nucleic acid-binding Zn-ribbon protein
MKDSQLLEIEDRWCRKMVEEARHAVDEIETRLAIAREKRLSRQSPEMTRALEIEIAALQRIREELEFDIESWISRPSSHQTAIGR